MQEEVKDELEKIGREHNRLLCPSTCQLSGFENSFTHGVGKVNWHEISFGVEIILAGFVNNAQLSVTRCGGVGKYLVKLSQFKRGWILFITNANDELGLFFHDSSSRLILYSLAPIPCASYQWISAGHIVPSSNLMLAMPFSFRQRPLPYLFQSR